MKKIMSLLLALLLAAALTVSAFAQGFTNSAGQEGEDPVNPNPGGTVPGGATPGGTVPSSPQTGEADAVWVIAGIAGLAAGTCIVVKKRSTAC